MPNTRTVAVSLLLLAASLCADAFPDYAVLRQRANALWGRRETPAGAYLVLVPPRSPLRDAKFVRFR
ncbi:MAG: hypothetical protein ACYTEZ_14030 [Planctomycetota bacterium]|jgi:hypothetical protein